MNAITWVEGAAQTVADDTSKAVQTVVDDTRAVISSPITQDVAAGLEGAVAGAVTGGILGAVVGGPVGFVAGLAAGAVSGAVGGVVTEVSTQNAVTQANQQAQTTALGIATQAQTADETLLESYFGADYISQGFTVSLGTYDGTSVPITISDAAGNQYSLGAAGTPQAGQVLYANGPNAGQVAMGITQSTALDTAKQLLKTEQGTIDQTYGANSGYTVNLGTYDATTGSYGLTITDATGTAYGMVGAGTNAGTLFNASTNAAVQTPAQIAAALKVAGDAAVGDPAVGAPTVSVPILTANPTIPAVGTPNLSAGNKVAAATAAGTTVANLPNPDALGSFVGNQEIAAQQETNQLTIETNNFQAAQALAASQFNTQQGEQQAAQTTAEQGAYTSANEQVQASEEQIGTGKAQAASGYSTLVSNAAARGIKVTPGTANAPGTPQVTSDQNGKLSVTPGSSSVSPLAQLISYQSNANLEIANDETNAASAENLATSQIQSGTAEFETQMSDQLAEFNAQQTQDLSEFNTGLIFNQNAFNENQQQALAAYVQGQTFNQVNTQVDLAGQTQESALAEKFTQENLQSYDTSLWLNFFSNEIGQASAGMSKLSVPTYEEPAVDVIGPNNPYSAIQYGSAPSSLGTWGN